LSTYASTTALHSFPTRRSSDLVAHFAVPHGEIILEPTHSRAHDYRQFFVSFPDFFKHFKAGHVFHADIQHDQIGLEVLEEIRKRSEEHTSELQSRENIVCRLLL